jgi:hypothetical protein
MSTLFADAFGDTRAAHRPRDGGVTHGPRQRRREFLYAARGIA